jgi:hypothetical protein
VSHRLEDWGTQSNGRHRFVWRSVTCTVLFSGFDIGQKLSSQEFSTEEGSMSRVWFLDMYPAGYKSNSAISLYLHASKLSASAKPVRIPFQLCVFDFLLRDFVICANLCQTFSNEQRCWGKQTFISPNELFGLNHWCDRPLCKRRCCRFLCGYQHHLRSRMCSEVASVFT